MTIKDPATIANYVRHHSEMTAMLENLKEFVESMPSPDDNGKSIPNIDYGYTGDVYRIRQSLASALEVADGIQTYYR